MTRPPWPGWCGQTVLADIAVQTAGPGRPAYHCPGDVTAEDLGEERWTSFLPPEGLVGVEGWTSFLPPEGLVGGEVQVGIAVVVVVGLTAGQQYLHPQSVALCNADDGKIRKAGSKSDGNGWDRAAG